MNKQVNSQKEVIEVPIEIASEVKLFVNLLQTGEIEGVGDLLKKLNENNSFGLTVDTQKCQSASRTETELTNDQQESFSQLKIFTNSQDKFFRLAGYAGTGKSFLICHYIKWLINEKLSFVAACPTNKAAKNLRNLADTEDLELEVKTVAQLLGQQPELNEESGKEEFKSKGHVDLSGYDIVIIDEFSMLNKENFREIATQAQSSLLTKVVFVGDHAQLPPINEHEPIVASSELIDHNSTLTEVIRYDGDLARVAETIRSDPRYSRIIYAFTTTRDQSILCTSPSEWRERAISLFESAEYQKNPDYVRYLAWRNRTVESLNKFVRARLWGEDVQPYLPGDRLIARKPLFRPRPGAKGKNKWRILINSSEECQVIETGQLSELTFQQQTYQYWRVRVKPEEAQPQTLLILHEDSQKLHREQVKTFASSKQWYYYFDLSRMFDDVGYAYALTTHKAQGSSIEHVFLDVQDMIGCSDRQKLLYTALTRAKKQVFISQ
ncbi:Viral (Superfamily 1) RNA helicase [Xenococcus sp. PCC 7305]|uniref:ATP-dependent DNA helicase n=1 Tax=Xenococcus sp. PCC 7305 TaxID=102125 RepID=UPI0002ACC6CF|nr:DEAD/DEAH box helicase [Xenococcus sp. PCC 7305]ELS02848.1 Viral (Superfamily 1) RNA helicase [Xenococcus sp. PCC 7305]